MKNANLMPQDSKNLAAKTAFPGDRLRLEISFEIGIITTNHLGINRLKMKDNPQITCKVHCWRADGNNKPIRSRSVQNGKRLVEK